MSTAPVTDHNNHYFRVIAPFEILVKVGLEPANVFIGRAQALQELYQPVTTRIGDEIHALVGGDFLVRPSLDGKSADAYSFDTRRFAAHEVMLHPAPPMPKLPADALMEMPLDAATQPINYRANEPGIGTRIRVVA